jgi:deoxycytidine triphosphate deaminase
MLLHPESQFTSTKITDVEKGDVQPNAVDIRLEEVEKIEPSDFILDEIDKKHRITSKLPVQADGFYVLEPGSYKIIMRNKVEIGESEAGVVISRSSLIRNGVYLCSGLYDTGYKGSMVALMVVTTGTAKIKKGARVGQYLILESESNGTYQGNYGEKSV